MVKILKYINQIEIQLLADNTETIAGTRILTIVGDNTEILSNSRTVNISGNLTETITSNYNHI